MSVGSHTGPSDGPANGGGDGPPDAGDDVPADTAAADAVADDAGAGRDADGATVADAGSADGYEAPVGTLFLLMVYVMVLAGMWVTMYWMMVGR